MQYKRDLRHTSKLNESMMEELIQLRTIVQASYKESSQQLFMSEELTEQPNEESCCEADEIQSLVAPISQSEVSTRNSVRHFISSKHMSIIQSIRHLDINDDNKASLRNTPTRESHSCRGQESMPTGTGSTACVLS
jgi:hypothetical protein